MNTSNTTSHRIINEIIETTIYFGIRFIVVLIGLYIGYYFVTTRFTPVLDELCLTNTQNCTTVQVYRYKNTFVGRDNVSQIWFWYNGANLYVYGQAPGICQSTATQTYSPVNVFQMNMDKTKNIIKFSALPNECIDSVDTIVNYYKNTLNVNMESFIMSRANPTAVTNIYNIIQGMYDANIFKF